MPDSLWPTLILAGVLKENPLSARLLSYEVNCISVFYVRSFVLGEPHFP